VTVRLETQGRLARIILAKPPLNILDLDDLGQLAECIEQVDAAVLVLQAADDCRAFSAGNAIQDHTPERAPAMLERFHRAIRALLATDAITVADVRGDALGGGCELVTACDLVYASENARFGQPEIKVGCFPPVAAALLPRRIGWTRAMEMIATGRIYSAAECALVTRIGPPEIETLLGMSAPVLAAAKRAMRTGTLADAERIYTEELLPLDDCAEGIAAFLEKRPPNWRHS
jgi:cyclohexa-1,5-dienecarbonyl-CoA hydratase